MIQISTLRKTASALAFALSLVPIAALAGKDLSQLSQGAPTNLTQGRLPKERYVEFEAAKLTNPKLVWANLQLLREMGYEVPDQMTAEAESKLLNALAWVAVDRNLQKGEVTSERRTMVADFYGGWGIGTNLGSARAGILGEVQIKGGGITPLLKHYDEKHTARSTLHEAIKDAVWGEVLSHELPFGANRIVAIIDRGGPMENGEPQILEIRQDPIRMGHFVVRTFVSDDADIKNTTIAGKFLEKNLPVPQDGFPADATRGERILLGMREYARRIGIQYAGMNMRRLYHGATSESNIEINGRMIDFGTASAQKGFEKVQFLAHVQPFGDNRDFSRLLIGGLVDGMQLPLDLLEELTQAMQKQRILNKLQLPTWQSYLKSDLVKTFERSIETESNRMLLTLSGVPEQVASKLAPKHEGLAQYLQQIVAIDIAKSNVISLQEVPTLKDRPMSTLDRLFEAIHKLPQLGAAPIEAIIHSLKLPPTTVNGTKVFLSEPTFAALLSEWFKAAAEIGVKQGLSDLKFRKLLRANFEFRSRPMEALYLPELRGTTHDLVKRYLNGDIKAPGEAIHSIVQQSIRSTPHLKWTQAPTKILRDVSGRMQVQFYDAETDRLGSTEFKIGRAGTSRVQRTCRAIFSLAN